MINITLPDNTIKQYPVGVTGAEIAQSISAGLAEASLAVKVNGVLQDVYLPILSDAHVVIITSKSPEALELLRHDAAHILAQAVKELYPQAQITIGPVIEDGFYYDIACDHRFTPEDLEKIEAKMAQIAGADLPIRREVWQRNDAIKFFKDIGEHYKSEIIQDLPEGEEISIYRQGDDFLDLCRGPHAPSTKHVKAFKLTKLAGAYWRGDSKNPMLQRIYGTAWPDQKQLKAYLTRLEEAEKRDHRRLGKEMGLFHIQEEAPGMIFWHARGYSLYNTLEQYIRNKIKRAGYEEVKTPIILDRSFWEASGHWDKFRENMFITESEDRVYALKPMNCPCHVQIFNSRIRSYRDLPLRMSEFGTCHRNEPSGSLHGALRVRCFTQDDAHIFCTEDQIVDETIAFTKLLKEVYADFGFTDIKVKFSDRPEKRVGSDVTWDKAEAALITATKASGLEYTLNPGEGAFYGPKLEFVLKDAIGRDWQLGTLQLDFVLPERLGANYVGPDGEKHHPVMIHRAVLGTFERFIGILIEHYCGRFPLWLAPEQAVILTITDELSTYAKYVHAKLSDAGLRVVLDKSSDTLNYKIRRYTLDKIPLMLILGRNEEQNGTVTVRRGQNDPQETLHVDELIVRLLRESTMPQ